MKPDQTRTKQGAIALAAAGLLLGLAGVMHPRVDTDATFENGLAGMFESGSWLPSHLLTLAGFATAAVALTTLIRAGGGDWSPRLRTIAWVGVAVSAFAAIEAIPHLLAESEAAAVRAGDSAPLTDLHTALQAFSTPLTGLTIAALALVGHRTGSLDGGRIATCLAVLGGTVYSFAGPVIALTKDSSLSPLFIGTAGLAVWLVVCGIRVARRASEEPAALTASTAALGTGSAR